MSETLTTIFGTIVSVAGTVCGLAVGGQIFEAADVFNLVPAVGNVVLADWLPSAGQWVIIVVV